jgi:hypothetical protein
MDLRQTPLPRSVAELFHVHHGKHILIGAIAMALLVYAVRRRRDCVAALRLLWRPALLAYVAAGLFLALGSVFEDMPGGGYWVVMEEVSEMNGFLLLLLTGIFFPF